VPSAFFAVSDPVVARPPARIGVRRRPPSRRALQSYHHGWPDSVAAVSGFKMLFLAVWGVPFSASPRLSVRLDSRSLQRVPMTSKRAFILSSLMLDDRALPFRALFYGARLFGKGLRPWSNGLPKWDSLFILAI